MKKFLQLSFLFSFLLLSTTGMSNHFAGGFITYVAVANNTYKFTYTLYRDCGGATISYGYDFKFKCSHDSTLDFVQSFTRVPGTGLEVTNSCVQIPTNCTGGTGSNYGIQEYLFEAIVTLPQCDSWIISNIMGGTRTPSSTSPNVSYLSYKVSISLNNLYTSANNSPQFILKQPFIINTNHPVSLKFEAKDIDGDSLAYFFYNPEVDTLGNPLNYYSPYSFSNFISSSIPITINAQTGEIQLLPYQNMRSFFGILVKEYRTINNVVTEIGYIKRDVFINSSPLLFNPPVLGGINFSNNHTYNPNDSIYYTEVHYHNNMVVEFDISGYDSDTLNIYYLGSPEKFMISWNNDIPGAYLNTYFNNTNSAFAHFSWPLLNSDISNTPKCFYVKIQDFSCPYYLINYKKYCIKVLPDNTGINESSKNLIFISQNYPNPAKDYTLIDIELAKESNASIQITDICGRKVLEKDFGKLPNGKSTLEIPLEGIAPGLYFYTLVIGNERVSKKMVVE